MAVRSLTSLPYLCICKNKKQKKSFESQYVRDTISLRLRVEDFGRERAAHDPATVWQDSDILNERPYSSESRVLYRAPTAG